MLQERWKRAYINPKLGIFRGPALDDEKDGPVFDLEEALRFGGFQVESLFPITWPTEK